MMAHRTQESVIETRLAIASHLLGSLLTQAISTSIEADFQEADRCIAITDYLIARCRQHTPPTPSFLQPFDHDADQLGREIERTAIKNTKNLFAERLHGQRTEPARNRRRPHDHPTLH